MIKALCLALEDRDCFAVSMKRGELIILLVIHVFPKSCLSVWRFLRSRHGGGGGGGGGGGATCDRPAKSFVTVMALAFPTVLLG